MATHLLGTDYATIQAWHDAERNTVDAEGAILQVPAGTTTLTGNFQFRYGSAAAITVTAAPGAECVGDIRTATLPSIAVLDAGGFNLDFRENNVKFLNMYVRNFDFTTTGDTYNELTFEASVIDAYFNMTNNSTNVNFTDSVAVQHPGDANGNANKVIDLQGAVGMTGLRSSFINAAGGTSSANACVFLRTTGASSFNRCVLHSPTNPAFLLSSGTAPTGSANNAASDATFNAYGAVTAGVTSGDFMDYAARDYRLKSESVPALLGTTAGAFIQAVVDQNPQLDSAVPDVSFATGSVINIDIGQHFSDPNAGDTLTFSVTGGTMPTGMALTSAGFLTSAGTEGVAGAVAITVTASDGAGPTASDTFNITITAIVPIIVDVDGDNSVEAGQVGVVVNGTDLDVNPTTQNILLGGQALTVTDWSTDDPVVTIPLHIALDWDRPYTFSAEDDAGVVTFGTQVTLAKPATWSVVEFTDVTIPTDTAGTETVQEHTPSDTTIGSITLAVGDRIAFATTTGLTIGADGSVQVVPAASVSIPYKIWDASANAWTPVSTLNINNTGAAAAPPLFAGTIGAKSGKIGVALSGESVSTFFSNAPTSYAVQASTLPAGVTLDNSGNLVGTPTAVGVSAGIVIRATNADGFADSNAFTWTVVDTFPPLFSGTLADQTHEIGTAIDYDITGPWSTDEEPKKLPTSYAVTAETLPAGISLTAAGKFVGTTQAIGVNTGIVVTGTNADGSSSSNVFSWTVTIASNAPVISETLVDGVTGVPYANKAGVRITVSGSFGGTQLTVPTTFSTDANGLFSVAILGLTLGAPYFCEFISADGAITELHVMTAKAP